LWKPLAQSRQGYLPHRHSQLTNQFELAPDREGAQTLDLHAFGFRGSV
jgi:hypothetical protein